MSPAYDGAYFEAHAASARRSAEAIVPLVIELVAPRSVCDVGCGMGTWLSVFREHGVERALGIDGEPTGGLELEIPRELFVAADLEQGVPSAGRFDLAVCLEVAEHLSESAGAALVDGLVALAPVVLFAAAIPGQGGRHHVSERWPQHWQALFDRHGYVAVDCVRPRIWDLPGVEVWYRQNVLLYAERAFTKSNARLSAELHAAAGRPLAVVHPRMLELALVRPWRRLVELRADRDAGRITQEELEEELARLLERFARRAGFDDAARDGAPEGERT